MMTPNIASREATKVSGRLSETATAAANWEPRTVGVTPAERLTSGGNQYDGSILRDDRRSDLVDDPNS
jgi:hypothetical protein